MIVDIHPKFEGKTEQHLATKRFTVFAKLRGFTIVDRPAARKRTPDIVGQVMRGGQP